MANFSAGIISPILPFSNSSLISPITLGALSLCELECIEKKKPSLHQMQITTVGNMTTHYQRLSKIPPTYIIKYKKNLYVIQFTKLYLLKSKYGNIVLFYYGVKVNVLLISLAHLHDAFSTFQASLFAQMGFDFSEDWITKTKIKDSKSKQWKWFGKQAAIH